MRHLIDNLPFSSQYDFACWRAFKYEGVQYQKDDPFPAEGIEKPSATVLEKLYRQKSIVVAGAPAQPVVAVKALSKAALKAEKARLAAAAESEQVEQASEDDDDDDQTATAEPAADDDSQSAGDAGGGGTADQPDADAAGAPADQPMAGVKPIGPLTRVYKGFSGHDVVASNGVIVHTGIKSKDEADALAAAGLPPE